MFHFQSSSQLLVWGKQQDLAQGSRTRVGDLEKSPGSQTWTDPDPATAALWGMSQQMKDLSLPLRPFFCNSDFGVK